MKIILKHTLKNIFGKPGRTFLILFCITLCTFVAIVSTDLTNAMNSIIRGMMSEMAGTTDVMAVSDEQIDLSDPKYPANTTLEVRAYENTKYAHDEEAYYIAREEMVYIYSMNLDAAEKLKVMKTDTKNFGDDECLVNEGYLESYNVNIGDSIVLIDSNKNEVSFKIAGVTSDMSTLFDGYTVIITDAAMNKLNPNQKEYRYLIDLENDDVTRDVYDQLRNDFPRGNFTSLVYNDATDTQLKNGSRIFMLILLICILMVIFVTISVSDRVICERMAVIGTFRSLGFSRNVTTGILLAENAIYGLIGSLIGIGLYAAIRLPLLNLMLAFDPGYEFEMDFGSISPLAVVVIILLAVFIECMCSIKEIVKAVKTPIRDIIFSTKDTAYTTNKVTTIIGIVLMVAGIVLFFFKNIFICQIIAIVFVALAISMLSPYFFIHVGKFLSNVFEKNGKIIPSLAVRESYTKKNTVGASVLITTIVTLCILVMVYASSVVYDYQDTSSIKYDVAVNVEGEAIEYKYIETLPGVTDVEYVYADASDTIVINGVYSDLNIVTPINEGGFKYNYNSVIKDLPTELGKDEIYVSRYFLNKCNLKVGDTYDFIFKKGSPVEFNRSLKIAGYIPSTLPEMYVNFDFFDEIYNTNSVANVYIKTDNPDETANTIRRYSSLTEEKVKTRDEQIAADKKESQSFVVVIYVVLAIGCIVTFIGAAGNLLLGFESRKRECAVLLSTSLNRKQLSFSLFLESFFASLSAMVLAIPFGFLLLIPINNIFIVASEGIVFHYDFGSMALTLFIMLIAFTFTSIQPIRKLRKMKLSEQLKYE